jgi:hypothetical protein
LSFDEVFMKIEALESIKSDGYVLDAEDVKNVPYEIGSRWCVAGWAKDLSGSVQTGERKVVRVDVNVDAVGHKNATTEL